MPDHRVKRQPATSMYIREKGCLTCDTHRETPCPYISLKRRVCGRLLTEFHHYCQWAMLILAECRFETAQATAQPFSNFNADRCKLTGGCACAEPPPKKRHLQVLLCACCTAGKNSPRPNAWIYSGQKKVHRVLVSLKKWELSRQSYKKVFCPE